MLGTNIYLTHQLAQMHVREMLAEAELQHSANIARAARPQARRAGFLEARAAVATLLLRVGSWLMPEEMPDAGTHPVAFELRPGQ